MVVPLCLTLISTYFTRATTDDVSQERKYTSTEKTANRETALVLGADDNPNTFSKHWLNTWSNIGVKTSAFSLTDGGL